MKESVLICVCAECGERLVYQVSTERMNEIDRVVFEIGPCLECLKRAENKETDNADRL
jgi:hypothetical protein